MATPSMRLMKQSTTQEANPKKFLTTKEEYVSYLTKFVDELPIMPVISPTSAMAGVPFFNVDMVPFTKKLHRDLPPTPLWGYNGHYPGPTFEARERDDAAVRRGRLTTIETAGRRNLAPQRKPALVNFTWTVAGGYRLMHPHTKGGQNHAPA